MIDLVIPHITSVRLLRLVVVEQFGSIYVSGGRGVVAWWKVKLSWRGGIATDPPIILDH